MSALFALRRWWVWATILYLAKCVSIPTIQLGTNYYSEANFPKTGVPCLDFTASDYFMMNPRATFEFSLAQSLSTLENALGVDVSTSIGWGMFSLDARAQYASSQRQSSYDLNLNYLFQYSAQAVLNLPEDRNGTEYLSRVGLQHYNNGATDFLRYCGDSFIQEAQAGVTLVVTYNLHFNNQVDKESFQGNLGASYGSMVSVAAQIKQATDKSQVSMTLHLKAIQLGGNPERLQDILGESEGGQYTLLECGSSNPTTGTALDPSPCIDVINKIIDYAHAQGAYKDTGLEKQIQVDAIGRPVNPNAFYFTNPVSVPWAQINAEPQIILPAQEVRDAQKNLTTWYKADTQNLAFVSNYVILVDSLFDYSAYAVNALRKIKENLENRVASYTDVGVIDCFTGGYDTTCTAKYNAIRDKREAEYPIDEGLLALFDTAYMTKYKELFLRVDIDPPYFKSMADYLKNSPNFMSLHDVNETTIDATYYEVPSRCPDTNSFYTGYLKWYSVGGSDCYTGRLDHNCLDSSIWWDICKIKNPM